MDKNTFIRELRQALSVLQEDELNDIVNEYEQHIDMKMKSGLTEAEAIADFGSMQELTTEILAAYHVRADYAEGQRRKKPLFFKEEGDMTGKELLQQTKKHCRTAGVKANAGLQRLRKWIEGILLFWKKQLGKPISFLGRKWRDRQNCWAAGPLWKNRTMAKMEESDQGEEKTLISRIWGFAESVFRRGLNLIINGFCFGWKLALLGIRAAWNVCCVGTSLMFAAAGLLCLYLLGLLIVLWIQRYPLAGVTVGCLGLVLCTFSAAGFCLTLLWKKTKRE